MKYSKNQTYNKSIQNLVKILHLSNLTWVQQLIRLGNICYFHQTAKRVRCTFKIVKVEIRHEASRDHETPVLGGLALNHYNVFLINIQPRSHRFGYHEESIKVWRG